MQEQIQEGGQGSSIQNGQKEQNMRMGKKRKRKRGQSRGVFMFGHEDNKTEGGHTWRS